MGTTIDFNSDLGEVFGSWKMGDDIALLDIVTSANIAYGYHTGDAGVMMKTYEATAARGVRIGVHVVYRDLAGFGRRRMDYSYRELRAETIYQIGALSACARTVGTEVSYVRPHGALYNRIAVGENQAAAVVEALLLARSTCGDGPAIMTQPGSVIERLSLNTDLPVIRETFADRAYNSDRILVSRALEGSIIVEPDVVVKRVIAVASGEPIVAYDGSPLTVQAGSTYLHGDTPDAVELSRMIRQGLVNAGVTVAAHVQRGLIHQSYRP